jgi:hypothetical protein
VLVEGKGRDRTLKVVRRPFDPTGLKVLGDTDKGLLTPYGRKELARRRAARKRSHESRRRNR